jgi:hypothetical protein
MAQAPKPKAKPKPKSKFKDKEQSERFIEAARKLGIEETSAAFENAMKIIVPPARPSPLSDESPKSRKIRECD